MNRHGWNALREGDYVMVHDESDPSMKLIPGRVVEVISEGGSNGVAIRITPPRGKASTVSPSRLMVHAEPLDPDGHCWRCDTAADAAARERRNAPSTA
jgi:hypothetical protein